MLKYILNLTLILLFLSSSVFAESNTIYFGWDIMLSRTVGAYTKIKWTNRVFGKYNPTDVLDKWTLEVFNLESPFSYKDKDLFKRTFSFWSNIKNIKTLLDLKNWNPMVLSLANNHITNSGISWLSLTVSTLEKNWIKTIGVSKNKKDKYKIIEANWINYCINAYTYDWRAYKDWKDIWYVNNISEAVEDVKLMNNDPLCNNKIVVMHWGNEYDTEPTSAQVKLAHSIIENWADLIIGSHSHIYWKQETYLWKDIFYSMWNFVFDQNWWMYWCQKNMFCKWDNKLKKSTVPTYIWTGVKYNLDTNEYSLDTWLINNGRLWK